MQGRTELILSSIRAKKGNRIQFNFFRRTDRFEVARLIKFLELI